MCLVLSQLGPRCKQGRVWPLMNRSQLPGGLAPAATEELVKALTAWRTRPLTSFFLPSQRLKASLTASSSLNGSNLVVGSASTMVTARPEQSQILVQHPDAPSPAQPQVCCVAQPARLGWGCWGVSGPRGKGRKTLRLPGLQNGLKTLFFQCCFSTNALRHHRAENFSNMLICLTRSGVSKEYFALFSLLNYWG